MKTISVGELRQNPTQMLDDVAAGEVYVVTRHNREVAHVIPTVSSSTIMPPRTEDPAHTADLTRIDLPDGISFDGFLRDLSGEW